MTNSTVKNNGLEVFKFTVNRNSKNHGIIKTPKELVMKGVTGWIQDSALIIDTGAKQELPHLESDGELIVKNSLTGIEYKIFEITTYQGTRSMIGLRFIKV